MHCSETLGVSTRGCPCQITSHCVPKNPVLPKPERISPRSRLWLFSAMAIAHFLCLSALRPGQSSKPEDACPRFSVEYGRFLMGWDSEQRLKSGDNAFQTELIARPSSPGASVEARRRFRGRRESGVPGPGMEVRHYDHSGEKCVEFSEKRLPPLQREPRPQGRPFRLAAPFLISVPKRPSGLLHFLSFVVAHSLAPTAPWTRIFPRPRDHARRRSIPRSPASARPRAAPAAARPPTVPLPTF
jgi:hypothetical protein